MGFNLPLRNYFNKMSVPTTWVRPNDWPVITDADNEVQFLMSDIDSAACTVQTTFTRTTGSQDIIIDWGDGTTNTITATTSTNTTHQYTPGTGTPCSRGYTTFKIRVYFTGIGTSVLNSCRIFDVLIASNVANPYTNMGVLEAYYGNGTQTVNMTQYYQGFNSTSGICNFNYLEYVKLPQTVTFASLQDTFNGCTSLYVVVMPTSASSLTNVLNTFGNCHKLQSITFPANATGITTFSTTFSTCYNLASVVLPATANNNLTFNQTFINCFSLKNVTLPTSPLVTTYISAFAGCTSLEWVKFRDLPSPASLSIFSFNATFQNCRNLQTVYFPDTCSSNAVYNCQNIFQNCSNLKRLVFPINFNPNNLDSAFNSCLNLKSVVFQSTASSLTTMNAMFQNCYNLTNVVLPSSVSASGVIMTTAFNNCTSLKTITIPNGYLITAMVNTFTNCYSLKTINWTPGTQNSLTTLSSTFQNCYLLESITMPSSMNAVNDMSSTFNNCKILQTVVLPSSMDAVTTFNGTFAGCNLLTSITMPSSASSCTNFTGCFSNCNILRTITLPNVVSSAFISMNNTFNGCSSLTTITFPGSQQLSSLNTLVSVFSQCGNLQTLNNFDKLGSLTATPLVAAGSNGFCSIPSISFVAPLSQLGLNNTASTTNNGIQSIRLLNTSAGQWTGTSPQINVSYTSMSTAALVQLFNDMAAQGSVVSKTINITGATGAAGLSASDRLIITSIGWTITG